MITFALAFAVFALALLGMAVGVLRGRSPIAGSCGGLGGSACGACDRPCSKRRRELQRGAQSSTSGG